MTKYLLVRPYNLALILLLLLAGCGSDASADLPEPTIDLASCTLTGGLAAECAELTVPEDRTDPSGRTLDLNIVVVPSTSSEPEPDPLFLLAGGPGQAATEAFPPIISLFDEVRRTRDIVMVDQRGTGESAPLTCPNLEDETLPADLSDEAFIALLDECREELSERTDLTQYTTDDAIDDLDAVREALGYEQINLYGASYGTRLAQAYMKRYPEQVRSAVLEAVVGPELVLFQDMPRDGQRALDDLFERCAADEACSAAFPNLASEFETILQRLEQPVDITVPGPLDNEPIDLELTRELFAQLVFNILYSTEFQSLLPLLIHHAHETGEYGPLVAQALAIGESASLQTALLYAVTCSEDAPLVDLETARAIQEGTAMALPAERFLAICETWPRAEVPPDFRTPLQTETPVLLLSGNADPVTPPSYAEAVAANLPNSRHLVLPGHGHTVLTAGCVPSVLARFVIAGSVAGLDAACIEEIEPPPFFVTFAGPRP